VYNLKVLKDRSLMLKKVRSFFDSKNILEVDCKALQPSPSIDAYIDLIEAPVNKTNIHYLHSSPEYAMKKLLSYGFEDIYQLGHVFRDGEKGKKHAFEFTMIEWYRKNISFDSFIEECIALIHLFIPNLPYEIITYKNLFLKHLKINPHQISLKQLQKICEEKNLLFPTDLTKDDYLNLLLTHLIEPSLPQNTITIICNYPSTQSALAKLKKVDNDLIAERFEIYIGSMELGNGYHELTDSREQKKRFDEQNNIREKLHKKIYEIDNSFLKALDNIFDSYFGIAIGFDRLMMLRHQIDDISKISFN